MNNEHASLYIGIMTGTSLDAIDLVACSFEEEHITIKGEYSAPWPESLRSILMMLSTAELVPMDTLVRTHFLLAEQYAKAVKELLLTTAIPQENIVAIGLHGQTVRHLPAPAALAPDLPPVRATLQLGSGTSLAALTGINVISDFRSADVALGGQGAPLVPMFDVAFLSSKERSRLVVNIGGISNITWIPKDQVGVRAFDTGPGNMIIDALAAKYLGQPFDKDGEYARRGTIDQMLLEELLQHPYFQQEPPKSTGRELFGRDFFDFFCAKIVSNALSIDDALATACELTARCIIDAFRFLQASTTSVEIIVSGGGSKNSYLMERIQKNAPDARVTSSDMFGIPSQSKEAIAFAFFAKAYLEERIIHLPATTGATHTTLLGTLAKGSVKKQ